MLRLVVFACGLLLVGCTSQVTQPTAPTMTGTPRDSSQVQPDRPPKETPQETPKTGPAGVVVLEPIQVFETDSSQNGQRLTLSPDGTQAVTVIAGGRLWDTVTGKELPWKDAETAEYMKNEWVGNAVYSADGSLLWANRSSDKIVAIDVKTHKIVQTIPSEQARGWILQVSPEGKYLATQEAVFDIASKSKKLEFGKEHGRLEEVLFGHDGKHLVTRGEKGICLWDLDTGKVMRTMPFLEDSVLENQFLSCSPTEDVFAVRTKSGDRKVVEIRDLKSGDVKAHIAETLELRGGNLAWSPDGKLLTVPVVDQTPGTSHVHPILWVFDVKSGKPVATLPPTRGIERVTFSGKGNRLGIIAQGKEPSDKNKLMLLDLTKLPR
jgi:WD40 repeat protein